MLAFERLPVTQDRAVEENEVTDKWPSDKTRSQISERKISAAVTSFPPEGKGKRANFRRSVDLRVSDSSDTSAGTYHSTRVYKVLPRPGYLRQRSPHEW